MFLTFRNLTKQFEPSKSGLRFENGISSKNRLKKTFSATMLSLLLAVAKIGFFMV